MSTMINKTSKVTVLAILMVTIISPLLFSQSSRRDDPAVQRARQEMEVAQDLGRLLGFIYQMVQNEPRLSVNPSQSRALHTLINQVLNTTRLDPRTSESFIQRIEDDILTPAQLMYTDRLFAARDTTRMPSQASQSTTPAGTGTPQGTASGRSSTAGSGTPSNSDNSTEGGIVTVYMNGGPYNPLADTTRQQGQDIVALLRYLETRM